jgi:pyridoxamine 5'-phosphate oxidase
VTPDFTASTDPIALFRTWLAEAERTEPNDPNAMSLATVDADGLPDVRIVLLKSCDGDSFVFYTNRQSAKGEQLAANPRAALCFYWKSLGRQIRVRGGVIQTAAIEADEYFATRARGSRLGAWASQQSRPLESRFALEKAFAKYAAKFGNGVIPRPDYWGGYKLVPSSMEFWADQKFRLHDRILFTKAETGWTRQRLFP